MHVSSRRQIQGLKDCFPINARFTENWWCQTFLGWWGNWSEVVLHQLWKFYQSHEWDTTPVGLVSQLGWTELLVWLDWFYQLRKIFKAVLHLLFQLTLTELPSLHSLPINKTYLKPSMDSSVTCWIACPKLQFLCLLPNKLIFGLPQFTSS